MLKIIHKILLINENEKQREKKTNPEIQRSEADPDVSQTSRMAVHSHLITTAQQTPRSLKRPINVCQAITTKWPRTTIPDVQQTPWFRPWKTTQKHQEKDASTATNDIVLAFTQWTLMSEGGKPNAEKFSKICYNTDYTTA